MRMAAHAGFSVFAHSSRRNVQRRSAASRPGSAANSVCFDSAFSGDSFRDSRTNEWFEGSSHPDSNHSAISRGGSGGRVNCGRWTLRTKLALLAVSALWVSALLDFAEPGLDLAAPCRMEG